VRAIVDRMCMTSRTRHIHRVPEEYNKYAAPQNAVAGEVPSMRPILSACLIACCSLGWLAGAWAQTDEIQVYDATIAAPGTFSLDWHNNYAASAALTPAFPGSISPNHSLNGVTEWA